MKSIAENTANQGVDIEALLNIAVRLGIASVKQEKNMGWLKKTIESIVGFLGFPSKEKIERIPVQFDTSLGVRKKLGFRGFGPAPKGTNKRFETELKKVLRTLEEGKPDALRKILDSFLDDDDVPVLYEEFLGEEGAPTLSDLIENESGFQD